MGRHLLLGAGGADHLGVAELHQAGALGVLGVAGGEGDGAKIAGAAVERAHGNLVGGALIAPRRRGVNDGSGTCCPYSGITASLGPRSATHAASKRRIRWATARTFSTSTARMRFS